MFFHQHLKKKKKKKEENRRWDRTQGLLTALRRTIINAAILYMAVKLAGGSHCSLLATSKKKRKKKRRKPQVGSNPRPLDCSTEDDNKRCNTLYGGKVSSRQSLLTPGSHCSLLAVAQQSLLGVKISLLAVTAAHCQQRTVTAGHCQQSLLTVNCTSGSSEQSLQIVSSLSLSLSLSLSVLLYPFSESRNWGRGCFCSCC